VKLYFFPVAPNPTRVRLYVAEKAEAGTRIPLEEVPVNLPQGEQRLPDHLARNPFGRLPVLELDDGRHLLESLVIIEYLEDLYPSPPMIGSEPLERARVREHERIAELGVLQPVARILHATNSPLGLPPNPGVAAQFRELLPEGLGVLNDRLGDGRPFVAGPRVSIADCTLQAAFQFARFGKIDLGGLEHLTRWDREYRSRPAAQAVLVA
jgi:glutathione S-transferase